MFMMKGALALFISLAIGYGLCVVANKQKKGLLQTVGYTLGAAVITLSLLYGALESTVKMCMMDKSCGHFKDMKDCKMNFMKAHHK